MTGPTGVEDSHGDEDGITGPTGVLLGGGGIGFEVVVVVSHGVEDGITGPTGVDEILIVVDEMELLAHRDEKIGATGVLDDGGGGGGCSQSHSESASTMYGAVLFEIGYFGVVAQVASPVDGDVCEHVVLSLHGEIVPTPFTHVTSMLDAGPAQNVPVEIGHLITWV
jgi:hypothetical protein